MQPIRRTKRPHPCRLPRQESLPRRLGTAQRRSASRRRTRARRPRSRAAHAHGRRNTQRSRCADTCPRIPADYCPRTIGDRGRRRGNRHEAHHHSRSGRFCRRIAARILPLCRRAGRNGGTEAGTARNPGRHFRTGRHHRPPPSKKQPPLPRTNIPTHSPTPRHTSTATAHGHAAVWSRTAP